MTTADLLIAGSSALNKARSEIHMILGLMYQQFREGPNQSTKAWKTYRLADTELCRTTYEGVESVWTIEAQSNWLTMYCRDCQTNEAKGKYATERLHLGMEHILEMRAGLDTFVDALFERFPWMRTQVEPIIHAGKLTQGA